MTYFRTVETTSTRFPLTNSNRPFFRQTMAAPFLLSLSFALVATPPFAQDTEVPMVIDTETGGPSGAAPLMNHPYVVDGLQEQLLVDVAKWAMPLVSFFQTKDALQRDFGAEPGTTVFWSEPFGQEVQLLTPNDTSLYFTTQLELIDGEPQTIVIPPNSEDGLTIFGSIMNAWQTPIEDVGLRGWDQGLGATYFITPPGWEGEVPAGVVHRESNTFNVVVGLRITPKSFSADDLAAAVEYGKTLKIGNSPKFFDAAGKNHDALPKYDISYFQQLQRAINTEPMLPHDTRFYGIMEQFGLVPQSEFEPHPHMQDVIQRVKLELAEQFRNSMGLRMFPESKWELPIDVAMEAGTQFTYLAGNEYDWRRRAMTFHWAIWAPKYLGEATFYLVGQFDSDREPLDGDDIYKLTVPADVPARQFWSTTVYDMDTFAFYYDVDSVALNSLTAGLETNADGTVDIYFAPELPEGVNFDNWVPTKPGTEFMTLFRWYGPEPALFDGSWSLPEIYRQ